MNRKERRKAERKVNKEMEVMRKLPESEVIKINNIIEKVSKQRNDEMLNAVDVSLTALMLDKGYKFSEVSLLQDELAELLNEDIKKTRLMVKENLNMEKLQKEVRDFIVNEIKVREGNGIKAGALKKAIIEAIIFKFPKLSKAKAINAYGRVTEELKIKEMSTEEAAKYILEDDKKIKAKGIKKEEKKAEEIVDEVAKDVQEKIQKEEKEILENIKGEEKVSRFKINKQEVIKKIEFEGENGTYRAETNVGVELQANGTTLAFSSVQDLEKFCDEYRQAFELI